jgi:hypothetical protein
VKCPLLLSDFNQNSDVSTNVSNAPIPNLIEIHLALVSVYMLHDAHGEAARCILQLRVSSAPKIRVLIQTENKLNTRLMCGESQEIYIKNRRLNFQMSLSIKTFS